MVRIIAWSVGVAAVLTVCVSALGNRVAAQVGVTTPFPSGQSHYFEFCGGCHGLQGASAERAVPVLKGQVGLFMCTDEGRRYIVQLPNVAFAAADDRTLADIMNFVVFGLGAKSVPNGTKPFSPAEIGVLRKAPMKNQPLARMRSEVLARAISRCNERS